MPVCLPAPLFFFQASNSTHNQRQKQQHQYISPANTHKALLIALPIQKSHNMKPNRCLFSPLQTKLTHPPTGSSTRTKPKAKPKHTHTHTHTQEPELPKHTLLLPLLPPPSPYPSTESKPIRAKTIQPHLTLFSQRQSIPIPTFSFLSISLFLLFSPLPSIPTSSSFACFPPPQPKTRNK